ncbi:MAG: WG repeat-containing protein, partial [Clostridia bacterium]|nr:WG repeat-containing protein [Clostridia bacterium]
MKNGENYVCKDFDMTLDAGFYGGITVFTSENEVTYFKHDGTVFPFTPKYIPTEGKMIFWNEAKPEDGINVTDMEGNVLFHTGDVDKNGYRTTRIYPFNQGLAMADIAKFDENGNILEYGYGFINTEGKFVTLPYYRDFYRSGVNSYKIFNDGGLASIMKGGKYGAIDKDENERIPFVYDKIFTFQEGLAPFMKGDKWGVMDIYGNIIVEAKYKNITRFNGGLAIAHDGTKAVIIDRTGAEVKSLSNIDLSSYVQETKLEDGTVLISSNPPTDMLITKSGSSYGYTKLDFAPALPTEKDVDTWAIEEVGKAINNKLVPNELQNI